MRTTSSTNKAGRRKSGLSLLEMMVATSLLLVMMLGLTAMFNQTQRAFRSGLKQVDIFEGGRAVMDIIVRDVEQIAASKITNNLYAGPLPGTIFKQNFIQEFRQDAPAGTNGVRTNVLFSTYFLNHSSDWSAIAYRVLDSRDPDTNSLIIGSLYRISTNFAEFGTENLLNKFVNTRPSILINSGYMTRVADGIVHFRLQFYNTAGKLITNSQIPAIYVNPSPTGERITLFNNDSLPAIVEVELGILEPAIMEQARSMSLGSQKDYLEKQAGKVHIFRQQIAIRNAPR